MVIGFKQSYVSDIKKYLTCKRFVKINYKQNSCSILLILGMNYQQTKWNLLIFAGISASHIPNMSNLNSGLNIPIKVTKVQVHLNEKCIAFILVWSGCMKIWKKKCTYQTLTINSCEPNLICKSFPFLFK